LRGLLASISLKSSNANDVRWCDKRDEELVPLAKKIIHDKGIRSRHSLEKALPGLYHVLRARHLLGRAGLANMHGKDRKWASMNDREIVESTNSFIAENGITGRMKLMEADLGLYAIIGRRKLWSSISMEPRFRNWSMMDDNEVVSFARGFIRKNGIASRTALKDADAGLHAILFRRRLLDRVFAAIEKSKCVVRERELVEGLRQAADAMAEFGNLGND
jgi:hypothetical protein